SIRGLGPVSSRADVIDPGIAREVAVGLVAPRLAIFGAATYAGGIAKALTTAAHHRADAAQQQRSPDHAGRRGCCGSQKRTAATRRRRAIGLTIRALIILPGRLRLLHDLAAVPHRTAGRVRRRNVRHRAAPLALPADRTAP